MKRERKGIPTRITEKILKLMKTSGTDWQQPWRNKRFITCYGHILRGNNIVTLAALSKFERTVWATYDQWSDVGCQVQKGAKAVKLTVFKGYEEENGIRRPKFGRYIAFNIEQCDGDTAKFDSFDKVNHIYNASTIKEIETKLDKLGMKIEYGGDRACYIPSLDLIQLPKVESFETTPAYYSTRMHESGHCTGHKSRLDRDLKGKFGDSKYAMEELIAELTACFMCLELGIDSEPRVDHAKYLNSWIKLLEDDKRAFNMAVGKAQQATNYMLVLMGLEIREVA